MRNRLAPCNELQSIEDAWVTPPQENILRSVIDLINPVALSETAIAIVIHAFVRHKIVHCHVLCSRNFYKICAQDILSIVFESGDAAR